MTRTIWGQYLHFFFSFIQTKRNGIKCGAKCMSCNDCFPFLEYYSTFNIKAKSVSVIFLINNCQKLKRFLNPDVWGAEHLSWHQGPPRKFKVYSCIIAVGWRDLKSKSLKLIILVNCCLIAFRLLTSHVSKSVFVNLKFTNYFLVDFNKYGKKTYIFYIMYFHVV